MTCGIYILKFEGTSKVYVGQSITIESRYSTHKYLLKKGEHYKKLQEAYNLYGMPTISIIKKCTKEELDSEELQAISEYNSLDNGFNTAKGGISRGSFYGYDNYNLLYDKQVYCVILDMLVNTTHTHKEIASYLGVKSTIVRDIYYMTSHAWLKEVSPDNYAKLVELNSTKIVDYIQSSSYPPKVVSPKGEVLEVIHATNFAKEHGLNTSGLSLLLHKKILSHKGWILEGTKVATHYPEVLSPEGIMHFIPIGKAKEFALSHGLTQSAFQKLLAGKANSHKGWKLASKSIDLREPII